MATGKEHEVKGKLEQTKGAVKEGWGALTGDRDTEIEGKGERAKGALREGYGKLKDELTNPTPTTPPDDDVSRRR